jgi:hypothetical protein
MSGENRRAQKLVEETCVCAAWVLGLEYKRGVAEAGEELREMLKLLRPEDFTDPWCRVVWQAIEEIARDEGLHAINRVTVLDQLAKRGRIAQGMVEWASLLEANLPAACIGPQLARRVREWADRRRAAQISHQLAEGEPVAPRHLGEFLGRLIPRSLKLAFRPPPGGRDGAGSNP